MRHHGRQLVPGLNRGAFGLKDPVWTSILTKRKGNDGRLVRYGGTEPAVGICGTQRGAYGGVEGGCTARGLGLVCDCGANVRKKP
ncbi:hypothetical protein V6Z11_A10G114600 [Gossypium hirsutum]